MSMQWMTKLSICIPYDPAIALKKTFWEESSHLFKRNKNLCSQKNLQINFHSSFVRSNRTTPNNSSKSFNRWMLKTNKAKTTVVHPYREIKFSNEGNQLLVCATTWMNLNGIKLSEERIYIAWFTYTTFLEIKWQNPRNSEQVTGSHRLCLRL